MEESWAEIGKTTVVTTWVDAINNSDGEVFIWSRLVARDFREKRDKQKDLLWRHHR